MALPSGIMLRGGLSRAVPPADWVYTRAPAHPVVSQGRVEYLRENAAWTGEDLGGAHHSIPSGRAELPRTSAPEFGSGSRFVVMFAGNLGMVQGRDVIEAAASQDRADVEFVMWGMVRPRASRVRGANRWERAFPWAAPQADMRLHERGRRAGVHLVVAH